jgi:hypothetical protein
MSGETENQSWEDGYEMAPEYDFSKAKPSPYTARAGGAALVALDADVRAVFPDSKSVNAALRLLIQAAKSAQAAEKAEVMVGQD